MTVAVNDLFLMNAVGSVFGQRTILTNWYSINAINPGVAETTVNTILLDAVRGGGGGDNYETKLRAVMPPEWTLDRWTVQKIHPVRYVSQSATRGVAGTHAASCETANQAAALTFSTILAGRNQISTKKIGPLPLGATVQADGFLVAAYKTLLGSLGTGMETTIVDAGTGLSAFASIAHRDPPGSYTIILAHQVGDTIRVNRRRTVGVGI